MVFVAQRGAGGVHEDHLDQPGLCPDDINPRADQARLSPGGIDVEGVLAVRVARVDTVQVVRQLCAAHDDRCCSDRDVLPAGGDADVVPPKCGPNQPVVQNQLGHLVRECVASDLGGYSADQDLDALSLRRRRVCSTDAQAPGQDGAERDSSKCLDGGPAGDAPCLHWLDLIWLH
jgi:hypothetical protein